MHEHKKRDTFFSPCAYVAHCDSDLVKRLCGENQPLLIYESTFSLVSLPLHFRNYLSLAYGIAIVGASFGVPPTTFGYQ